MGFCVLSCGCEISDQPFRVNLDSIQAEANALLKRLTGASNKVSSTDDVKEQFQKVMEVSVWFICMCCVQSAQETL